METFYAIRQNYPDIEQYFVSGQIRLSEDGSIEVWDCPYERPTQEELETAWAEWESGALGRAKKEAVTEINRQAGEARSRIGTDIPFQGNVYQLKWEEAFAFTSDEEPNQYKYPLLYAEAQARGMELSTLVAEYAYNAVMWPRILAAIEAVRMKMRVMIEAATAVAEVEAILTGAKWPV